MKLKQILVFLLSLVWCVAAYTCHNEMELPKVAEKKLQKFHVYPTAPPSIHPTNHECPLKYFPDKPNKSINVRSLSPWTYEEVRMPDHFPDTYYEARCLCEGCIMEGDEGLEENYAYNSVPLSRSRVFLKKERCQDGTQTYHLRPVNVDIKVGCTCVRPSRSQLTK